MSKAVSLKHILVYDITTEYEDDVLLVFCRVHGRASRNLVLFPQLEIQLSLILLEVGRFCFSGSMSARCEIFSLSRFQSRLVGPCEISSVVRS